MDYPFNILQIEPTNDPKAIKRAYARLIKIYRPNDDPERFQDIHEAYQYALMLATSDNSDNEEEFLHCAASLESSRDQYRDQGWNRGRMIHQELPNQELLGGSGDTFADLYYELMEMSDPEHRKALNEWLNDNDHFWDLTFKGEFASYLLLRFIKELPPIHEVDFMILNQFFHFQILTKIITYDDMMILGDDLHDQYIMHFYPTYHDDQVREMIGERFFKVLQKPFNWNHFFFQSFPPWRAYRRSRQIDDLMETLHLDHRVTSLNQTQVKQWHSIFFSERRFPATRIIAQLHQLFLLLLLTPIIVSLISGMFGESFLFDPNILYFLKENSIKVVIVLLLLMVTFPRSEISEQHYQILQTTMRTFTGLLALIFLYSTYQFSYFIYSHPPTRGFPISAQNIVDRIAGSSMKMPTEQEREVLWEEALDLQLLYPNDPALNQLLLLYNANNTNKQVIKTTYYLIQQRMAEIVQLEVDN